MSKPVSRRIYVRQAIIIASLFVLIVLIMLCARYPDVVERYYGNGLYPAISFVLHPLLNIFPFSIGDLLYISVVIMIVYALIRLMGHLFRKRFSEAALLALRIITGVEMGVLLFYLLWGLNYFRPAAGKRLGLEHGTFTVNELRDVTAILIDSANQTRDRIPATDVQLSNDSIYSHARLAVLKLGGSSEQFYTFHPQVKSSLLTFALNYIGTSGYYNPFTSEAQINNQQPVFARPFVCCHEMAHQMGYGAEDEANFVGFLAASRAENKLLRYSAYHMAVVEFMYNLRAADSIAYKQLKPRISPAVRADLKVERDYWLSYQSKIEEVSSIFYDRFLKANNQPQGLDTYNQMVDLVIALHRKGKL